MDKSGVLSEAGTAEEKKTTVTVAGNPLRRVLVVHPFLFAAFPILALYAHNMAGLSFSETLVPLAIALGSTSLLLAVSFLATWQILRIQKSPRSGRPYRLWALRKAGILTSIFILLFFSYGHVFDIMRGPVKDLLPIIWPGLFVGGAYLVLRTRRVLDNATTILNAMAISLVVISSISIVAYEMKRPSVPWPEEALPIPVLPGEIGTPPDIYYIILDGYASASTLAEFYDFDNSEFIDYLTGRGFYIASRSVCNHVSTDHSLPSSLNMEYLTYLSEYLGEDETDLKPLYDLVQNQEVWQFLRCRGYRYIHIGSYAQLTFNNVYADVNFNSNTLSEFQQFLYLKTALRLFPSIADTFGFATDPRSMQSKTALYQFEKLAQIPDLKKHTGEPLFVFAHVVIPHVPYVFDRYGNIVTEEVTASRTTTENYLNQLVGCNEKVKVLVDEILAKSLVPPIIILQGDHGPLSWGLSDWYTLGEDERMKVQMRILNAYHFPEGGDELLYESISPVNSFRIAFNFYFGASYDLLSDKSYYSDKETPYQFVDVTETVKYD